MNAKFLSEMLNVSKSSAEKARQWKALFLPFAIYDIHSYVSATQLFLIFHRLESFDSFDSSTQIQINWSTKKMQFAHKSRLEGH